MSDLLFKSIDAMLVDTEGVSSTLKVVKGEELRVHDQKPTLPDDPKPITDFEKELLKGTLSPEELIRSEELIKTEHEEPMTKEELDREHKKTLITKAKVCALDRMGKHPLENPTYFNRKDKKELMQYMESVLQLSEDEITSEFNEVCCQVLFCPEAEYMSYPVSR
jgi:hypothetical protein